MCGKLRLAKTTTYGVNMSAFKPFFVGCIFASVLVGGVHAQGMTSLVCQGSGSVLESKVSNSMEYDQKSHSYTKSTSRSSTGHLPISGSVNVEISGSSVRLKLPHEMVPPMNSEESGWFTLVDTFVGDKEITGTLHLNFANKPKVRVDRMTGQISIANGLEDFSGNCNKIDTNSGPKF